MKNIMNIFIFFVILNGFNTIAWSSEDDIVKNLEINLKSLRREVFVDQEIEFDAILKNRSDRTISLRENALSTLRMNIYNFDKKKIGLMILDGGDFEPENIGTAPIEASGALNFKVKILGDRNNLVQLDQKTVKTLPSGRYYFELVYINNSFLNEPLQVSSNEILVNVKESLSSVSRQKALEIAEEKLKKNKIKFFQNKIVENGDVWQVECFSIRTLKFGSGEPDLIMKISKSDGQILDIVSNNKKFKIRK